MSLLNAISTFIICGLGIALNVCEIASLVHAGKTKVPFNITLISLAITDAFLALVISIITVLYYLTNTMAVSSRFGSFIVFCLYSSSVSSALHILFIAFQRLIAVLYPLEATTLITRKRTILTVILMWIISMAASVPVSMEYYIYQRIIICSPFVSTVVIIVCYFIINYKMARRQIATVTGQQGQNILIMLHSISVTIIYMICKFPYTIYALQQPVLVLKMTFPIFAIRLFFLQVILNPIVYFFFQVLKRNKCSMCSSMCHCFGS